MPGRGVYPAARGHLEIDGIETLRERRRAHRHLAARVHDEGIAVEHQLVLAADQIDEQQRHARLCHAPC